MRKAVLWLLDRLGRRPLGYCGVDYRKFRAIVDLKLRLDSKRSSTALRQIAGGFGGNPFAFTLVLMAIVSVFPAIVLAMAPNPLLPVIVLHAMLMVMVTLTLVSDYSTVLLDATDDVVVLPRPVSARTLFAARVAHVVVYLGTIAFAMAGFPIVAGGLRHGPAFSVLLLFTVVEALVLVVALVSAVYLVLVRFVSEEKVRDFVLYAQIVMTLSVTIGYQVVPRMFDVVDPREVDVAGQSWLYFFPPAWLAGALEWSHGSGGRQSVVLALLGLLAPVLALALVVRFADWFRAAGADVAAKRRPGSGSGARIGTAIGRALSRTRLERAGFEMTWAMCGRSRTFKMRSYPGVAVAVVLPLFFVFRDFERLDAVVAELGSSNEHLFMLYLAVMLAASVVLEIRFTDTPEAASVYRVLPLERPGPILLGAVHAVLSRFTVPVFALTGAVAIAFWGVRVVPDVALAGAVAYAFTFGTLYVASDRSLPFSVLQRPDERSSRSTRMLVVMILGSVIGVAHWGLLTLDPLAVVAALPVPLVVGRAAARALGRTGWDQVVRLPEG